MNLQMLLELVQHNAQDQALKLLKIQSVSESIPPKEGGNSDISFMKLHGEVISTMENDYTQNPNCRVTNLTWTERKQVK